VSESLAEQLALLFGAPNDRPPHEALSDREFRVMVMLASERRPRGRRCLVPEREDHQHVPVAGVRKMNMRNNASSLSTP